MERWSDGFACRSTPLLAVGWRGNKTLEKASGTDMMIPWLNMDK